MRPTHVFVSPDEEAARYDLYRYKKDGHAYTGVTALARWVTRLLHTRGTWHVREMAIEGGAEVDLEYVLDATGLDMWREDGRLRVNVNVTHEREVDLYSIAEEWLRSNSTEFPYHPRVVFGDRAANRMPLFRFHPTAAADRMLRYMRESDHRHLQNLVPPGAPPLWLPKVLAGKHLRPETAEGVRQMFREETGRDPVVAILSAFFLECLCGQTDTLTVNVAMRASMDDRGVSVPENYTLVTVREGAAADGDHQYCSMPTSESRVPVTLADEVGSNRGIVNYSVCHESLAKGSPYLPWSSLFLMVNMPYIFSQRQKQVRMSDFVREIQSAFAWFPRFHHTQKSFDKHTRGGVSSAAETPDPAGEVRTADDFVRMYQRSGVKERDIRAYLSRVYGLSGRPGEGLEDVLEREGVTHQELALDVFRAVADDHAQEADGRR